VIGGELGLSSKAKLAEYISQFEAIQSKILDTSKINFTMRPTK